MGGYPVDGRGFVLSAARRPGPGVGRTVSFVSGGFLRVSVWSSGVSSISSGAAVRSRLRRTDADRQLGKTEPGTNLLGQRLRAFGRGRPGRRAGPSRRHAERRVAAHDVVLAAGSFARPAHRRLLLRGRRHRPVVPALAPVAAEPPRSGSKHGATCPVKSWRCWATAARVTGRRAVEDAVFPPKGLIAAPTSHHRPALFGLHFVHPRTSSSWAGAATEAAMRVAVPTAVSDRESRRVRREGTTCMTPPRRSSAE